MSTAVTASGRGSAVPGSDDAAIAAITAMGFLVSAERADGANRRRRVRHVEAILASVCPLWIVSSTWPEHTIDWWYRR